MKDDKKIKNGRQPKKIQMEDNQKKIQMEDNQRNKKWKISKKIKWKTRKKNC